MGVPPAGSGCFTPSLRRQLNWSLLPFLLAAVACGPAQEGAETGGTSRPPRCDESGSIPELVLAPAVGSVTSRVTVEAQAEKAWLERQVADRIPLELGRGRQRLGLPGRVEYSLRRGAPRLDLEDERLVLGVPVEAEIAVCKPIAGFCPVYGRCSPRLFATVSVPLRLTKDYEVGRSAVDTSMTRGCRIAVFNADREVASRASQQAAELKREIDRGLPSVRPFVEWGWRALHARLDLGPMGCLLTSPKTLSQSQPQLSNGVLSTSVALTGTVALERACPPKAAAPLDLPELTFTSAPEPTLVELPLALPWSVVGREVEVALSSGPLGSSVKRVAAHGALVGGEPRVVLELHLVGSCGALWLTAVPDLDPETNRVRLHDIGLLPGTQSPATASRLKAIQAELASSVALGVLVSPRHAVGLIEERLRRELSRAQDVPVSLEAHLEPTPGRVLLDSQHLVPVVGIVGRLIVRPR